MHSCEWMRTIKSCCKYLIHNSWMKSSPTIFLLNILLHSEIHHVTDAKWTAKQCIMLMTVRFTFISLVHNFLWFTIWFSVHLSVWTGLGKPGRSDCRATGLVFFTKPTINRNGYYPCPASSLQCKSQIERLENYAKTGRRKWLTSVCRINRF